MVHLFVCWLRTNNRCCWIFVVCIRIWIVPFEWVSGWVVARLNTRSIWSLFAFGDAFRLFLDHRHLTSFSWLLTWSLVVVVVVAAMAVSLFFPVILFTFASALVIIVVSLVVTIEVVVLGVSVTVLLVGWMGLGRFFADLMLSSACLDLPTALPSGTTAVVGLSGVFLTTESGLVFLFFLVNDSWLSSDCGLFMILLNVEEVMGLRLTRCETVTMDFIDPKLVILRLVDRADAVSVAICTDE